MTLLIAQIERSVDENSSYYDMMMHEAFVVSGIGKKKDGKASSNPLKFNVMKSSKWRDKRYHRVYDLLLKVWRKSLRPHEKFEFWFTFFNTMERVRLWNSLVFTREWWRRVVQYSRR